MAHHLGNTIRAIDLGNPLNHLPKHATVVHLLKGLTLGEIRTYLTDQQDHGCGVLEGRVDTD